MVVAHPQKVKAIASARIKTDKIDYLILAKLLRVDMIPKAYLTPKLIAEDKEAQFLERLPGIGYYTALILSKEIGDINRFFSAKHLGSYAGLVPSTY